MTNTNQKQDGTEERAFSAVHQERYMHNSNYRDGYDVASDDCKVETATLAAENNRLRQSLRSVVQVFNDLETDCRTAFPKYDSWPMADDVVAKAKALLDTAERATDDSDPAGR